MYPYIVYVAIIIYYQFYTIQQIIPKHFKVSNEKNEFNLRFFFSCL